MLITLSEPVLESSLGLRLLSNQQLQFIPRKAVHSTSSMVPQGFQILVLPPRELQETCLDSCNPIHAGDASASNHVMKMMT